MAKIGIASPLQFTTHHATEYERTLKSSIRSVPMEYQIKKDITNYGNFMEVLEIIQNKIEQSTTLPGADINPNQAEDSTAKINTKINYLSNSLNVKPVCRQFSGRTIAEDFNKATRDTAMQEITNSVIDSKRNIENAKMIGTLRYVSSTDIRFIRNS